MMKTIDVVFDVDMHDRIISLHTIRLNANNFLYPIRFLFGLNEQNNDLNWDYVEWNSERLD